MKKEKNLNGSIESIKYLLDKILKIPVLWIVIISILTLISTISIDDISTVLREGKTDSLKIHFGITSITVILLISMWIPSLIKLIGLLGGGIKVNNTEFSTTGLIKALSEVLGAIDVFEPSLDKNQRDDVKVIRENAERELASTLTQNTDNTKDKMLELSCEFEKVRNNMRPSKERTSLQGNIFTQMRALCTLIRYTKEEVIDFLESKLLGHRMIGLAAVQVDYDIHFFAQIIKIIEYSRAAYEQYQAIRILENLIQNLDKNQCAEVKRVLEYQRSGTNGTIINPQDQGRWIRSAKILELIQRKIEE